MRRALATIAAVVAFSVFAPNVVSAEEANKPIREFDIATIEALGQHMYRQDQEAWKATDILLAKHNPARLQAAGARGRIVDEGADRDVVRFIQATTTGIEAAYDVTFAPGVPPVLSEPVNRTLSAAELAQYNARLLAGKNFDFRCSRDPANTVAFRDPDGKRWLVWVMSATSDTSVMAVGGHVRFTISEDGATLAQKDSLSKSCVFLPKNADAVGYFFTHIVSKTPVETHVFASLAYGATYFEGTPDGSVWKIEKGKISKEK